MASKSFKPRTEVDKIKSFIEGEDFKSPADIEGSFADLNRLDAYELADRLESINNQSLLMTWLICVCIRDKYKSDPEMGQFINELKRKNPYHPLCVVRQQTRNRYIHAGRLALKLKITDLNNIGISPTAFCEMAIPKNLHVAEKVYQEVKKKNYSVEYVQRLIEQAKAIPGEKQAEKLASLEVMDYDKPRTALRTIPVVANIAQGVVFDEIGSEIETAIAHHEFVPPISLPAPEIVPTTQEIGYNQVFIQMKGEAELEQVVERRQEDRRMSSRVEQFVSDNAFNLADISSDDLLLELASRNERKSDDEIKADFMLVSERYDRSFTELKKIFSRLVKWAESMEA